MCGIGILNTANDGGTRPWLNRPKEKYTQAELMLTEEKLLALMLSVLVHVFALYGLIPMSVPPSACNRPGRTCVLRHLISIAET